MKRTYQPSKIKRAAGLTVSVNWQSTASGRAHYPSPAAPRGVNN